MKRSLPIDFVPRDACPTCERPRRVCYCAHVTPIETKTRVLLLQHPREEGMAIGTARMASLCLPNSELHVGVDFEHSAAVIRALSNADKPAVLLYPSDDATDVLAHPPQGAITLVVVDGTWWQARKLVRRNPRVAALPRYAFRAETPSEYRIRREPDAAYVSTIEALATVLGALEGDPKRMRALLVPFRAMIDHQIHFAKTVRGARVRHKKACNPKVLRPPPLPRVLRERPESLVCLTAEANAWPYHNPSLRTSYRDELVHVVAHRPHTGATLDVVVKPRNPLAPSTTHYVGLSPEVLHAGVSLEALAERWHAFIRDDDVLCTWGHYPIGLLLALCAPSRATENADHEEVSPALLQVPHTRIDVRSLARAQPGTPRLATVDATLHALQALDALDALDATEPRASSALAPLGQGRAALRTAQLVRLLLMLGQTREAAQTS